MRAAVQMPKGFAVVDADISVKRTRNDPVSELDDLRDAASVGQIATMHSPVVGAIDPDFGAGVRKADPQASELIDA